MTTEYVSTIDISDARLDAIEDILDILRMYGRPALDLDSRKVTVTWEVGRGIADLWDLRTCIEEVEAQLSSYINDYRIGKPAPLAPVA